MTSTDDDAERLAVIVAHRQAEASSRTAVEARRLSRAAMHRWQQRIPPALAVAGDAAAFIADYRDAWLEHAENVVGAIDPHWLDNRGRAFHVLDTATIGLQSTAHSPVGFLARGIFPAVRCHLTRCRRPGPVAIVDVHRHAEPFATLLEQHPERLVVRMVATAITTTAAHEYAHAIDFRDDGTPTAHTPPDISQAMQPHDEARERPFHGARWFRALAHVAHRLRGEPLHLAQHLFAGEVRQWLPQATADAILAALAPELDETPFATPIADVLLRPAPGPFLALVDPRTSKE